MPPLEGEASRRQFLKLMGASLGLAGMSGCIRWPEEQLAPYAHRPLDRTPGTSVVYPTAFEIGGIAQGVLAVSYDGRPIKIEGNPSHPLNCGAADAIAQASVLEVYDPDRSRGVIRREGDKRIESSWQEFAEWAKDVFKGDGQGICVLSEATNSPSAKDMRARLQKALPKLEWYEWEPISDDNIREGLRMATGKPLRQVLELENADVIVALDADLFGGGNPLGIKYARDFAKGRSLEDNSRSKMNRLYVIEPMHTITGACADYRLAMRPGRVAPLTSRLAAALGLAQDFVPGREANETAFLNQLVADLKAHAGRSVIVAGPRQPQDVHATVAAINQKLQNAGKTVTYYPDPDEERVPHIDELRTLAQIMSDGKVSTLLVLGGNPVYDAPMDWNRDGAALTFAEALAKVPNRIHLALYDDETSQLCTWHLPRAHYLEAWGDVRAHDGTVSIAQPLIQPLFDGRSTIEVLAMLARDKEGIEGGGQAVVRRTVRALVGETFGEWAWRKTLSEGVIAGTQWKAVDAEELVDTESPRLLTDTSAEKALDLIFFPDSKLYDGRFTNNGWLQELADPMTRLTWDNAALMCPETAKKIGAKRDEMVAIEAKSVEVRAPAMLVPGMAEGVIAIALGYGRTSAGSIGNGVGQNAYVLRTSDSVDWGSGIKVRPTGEKYALATVQDHHVIDKVGQEAIQDRIPKLIIQGTHEEYQKDASMGVKHTGLPSIFNEHKFDGRVDGAAPTEQNPKQQFHKWGMAIDLTRCTGCGACVVACQAENNIPIVGKEQVLLGREMQWIRVDRYFKDVEQVADGPTADWQSAPQAVHQPLPCMHCENAPCESVCPVAATTHSQEGINMMTYNRCVGVRYCLNNCPYKVRRFNFFDYNRGTLKNLYVPNLVREPESELVKMQKNPEVTVRVRGVMEKCSYCIQRIENARIAARREGDRPLRDGEVQTACQQTCPAGAIVFGDLNDPSSEVSKLHAQARAYGLLDDYLNTKPRTVYLARIRNA